MYTSANHMSEWEVRISQTSVNNECEILFFLSWLYSSSSSFFSFTNKSVKIPYGTVHQIDLRQTKTHSNWPQKRQRERESNKWNNRVYLLCSMFVALLAHLLLLRFRHHHSQMLSRALFLSNWNEFARPYTRLVSLSRATICFYVY